MDQYSRKKPYNVKVKALDNNIDSNFTTQQFYIFYDSSMDESPNTIIFVDKIDPTEALLEIDSVSWTLTCQVLFSHILYDQYSRCSNISFVLLRAI